MSCILSCAGRQIVTNWDQVHRSICLHILVASIARWTTSYLADACAPLRAHGTTLPDLPRVSSRRAGNARPFDASASALSTWAFRKRAGQLEARAGPLGRVSLAHFAQSDIPPDGVTLGAELSISGSGEEVSARTEVLANGAERSEEPLGVRGGF